MRSRFDFHKICALLCCAALSACTQAEPNASAEELARAKLLYTQCVEDELGLELVLLDIRANGDINVKFAEGTTDADLARALSVCEPRIRSVLEPGGVSVLGPPKNLGRPATDKELNALLVSRAKLGFEGAILVEVAGERRVMAGFGELGGSSKRKPDTQTAFDCGSIMKEVTAAVVFLLEEDGALSREQTLAEFFADVPNVWRAVTLEQVLAHRAGFHEYHDSEGDFERMDRAAALEVIFAEEPLFAPGTDSAYSNAGYTLLAALIERVTAKDYRSVVRERVFEPLAMERSGFYGDALWRDGNVAVGRGADRHGDNDPSNWSAPTWALIGNGGLVSTLEDLLRFAKALDGDSLFRPETRAAFRRWHSAGSIADKALIGYAGGNDFGFSAIVGQVAQDSAYVIAASHVLSPITAEILGIEVVQALYGDLVQLPEGP